jgi:exodeoxyribonuclease X
MKIRVVDLETTGFKTETSGPQGVMEIGYTDVDGDIISPPVGRLVDCGIRTSIEARAVHHISDDMCAGEINQVDAFKILMEGDHTYFAAHNTDHEKQYFGGGDRPWICTYKIALRLWPDAPGHKLNELRYFLEVDESDDFEAKYVERPHRAPDDSYICAHVLRRVLGEAETLKIGLDRLVSWSKGPALLFMCFLKKHKNVPWSQVPADYLRWILEKSDITDRDIRATAKFYLKQKEGKSNG